MSRTNLSEKACTVARAAEVFGDVWMMMILREMFLGGRRFDALQRQTGAPTATFEYTSETARECWRASTRRLQRTSATIRIPAHGDGARFVAYRREHEGLGRQVDGVGRNAC